MERSDDIVDMDNRIKDEFHKALTHGMLVSNVAYLVSRELNLSEEMCQQAALAGMVHDIGKMKVNSYIDTQKEHSMSIDQMRFDRTHPTLGYAILVDKEFDAAVCNAVLYHHENYDGSGYPANLAGEKIPFLARILRVCDVFSALISERPYREAFDIDTAVELMIDEINHFDMRIFLAFQRVVQSNELIFALGNLSMFTSDEFHYEFNQNNPIQ